jgi:drug/metabolite transporter (DMT)-like permease
MNHPLGQACALLAAVCWAFSLVLFKRSGERISPISLNLFKNAVSIALLLVSLPLIALFDPEHRPSSLAAFDAFDIGILIFSGIIGVAVADTAFFFALNRIGVGLISIVDCAYSPFVVLFAYFLLSEQLTAFHYFGGALVLVGLALASQRNALPERTRRDLWIGMTVALLSMALMALGIVIATPVIRRMAILWATLIRFGAGAAALALFALLAPDGKRHWTVFRPSAAWKYAVPASILGAYLSLVLWMMGFKYTHAAIAAVLNQTSLIFAIILAAVVLKEPFGTRKVAAVALAGAGVVVITFTNQLLAPDNRPFLIALIAAVSVAPLISHLLSLRRRQLAGRYRGSADYTC